MLGSIPYKGREENKCFLKLNTNGVSEGGVHMTHSSSDFPQQINTSITKSTLGREESLPLLSSEWPFPFLM